MAIFLLLITWIMQFTCSFSRGKDSSRSFFDSTLLIGILVLVGTEGLSLFHVIDFKFVTGYWAMADVILYLWWRPGLKKFSLNALIKKVQFKIFRKPILFPERLMLLSIILLLAGTFIVGLITPPNNWDSMTYHLSRVMHWVQNRDVNFYPTHNLRQLYMAPFAEYFFLHVFILTGSDRFLNLVQWFFMLASIIGICKLTTTLGLDQHRMAKSKSNIKYIYSGNALFIIAAKQSQN